MSNIHDLRIEIDQIHKELYALFLRRRDLTMQIWKIKQEQKLPFFNSEREEQIVKDFVSLSSSELRDPQFDQLLSGLMNSILREYETYLKSKFQS